MTVSWFSKMIIWAAEQSKNSLKYTRCYVMVICLCFICISADSHPPCVALIPFLYPIWNWKQFLFARSRWIGQDDILTKFKVSRNSRKGRPKKFFEVSKKWQNWPFSWPSEYLLSIRVRQRLKYFLEALQYHSKTHSFYFISMHNV